jgi:hypothetical protein
VDGGRPAPVAGVAEAGGALANAEVGECGGVRRARAAHHVPTPIHSRRGGAYLAEYERGQTLC